MKLVVANWKMNPVSAAEVARLAKAEDIPGVVVCPPFVHLPLVANILSHAKLGAQDGFSEPAGAYTGEVSLQMVKRAGASYVIVGHSERRRYMRESDPVIAKKIAAALRTRVTPMLCVGEPLSVRRKGIAAAKRFVARQLKLDLSGVPLSPVAFRRSPIIIAYEPVWSISTSGTGLIDDPESAAKMIAFVKTRLPRGVKVLYGGSVNGRNAAGFLSREEIDGVLVGGASLRPKELLMIVESAR